jgi:hypothetical protein
LSLVASIVAASSTTTSSGATGCRVTVAAPAWFGWSGTRDRGF